MSKLIGAILAASIIVTANPSNGSCQSLAQTAAYILSGGNVDLSDIKHSNNDTARVPGYVFAVTTLQPEMNYQVTNQAECIITANTPSSPQRTMTFYLNNVILKETRSQEIVSNHMFRLSKFHLRGESHVVCFKDRGNQGCLRDFDSGTQTDNLPRIWNALNYLYSNFCTSAKRRSAF